MIASGIQVCSRTSKMTSSNKDVVSYDLVLVYTNLITDFFVNIILYYQIQIRTSEIYKVHSYLLQNKKEILMKNHKLDRQTLHLKLDKSGSCVNRQVNHSPLKIYQLFSLKLGDILDFFCLFWLKLAAVVISNFLLH